MNTKSNNIRLAIEWIDKQLLLPTRRIDIGNYYIIQDLNYFLSVCKTLLTEGEGANIKSAYRRTKLIKDFLTNEKA